MIAFPPPDLDAAIRKIERSLPGARIGVAACRFGGETYAYRQYEAFPLQSVFKFPLAVVALRAADRGELKIDGTLVVRKADLSVPHSPLGEAVLKRGKVATTWRDLLVRSTGESDNTAADPLMAKFGGPQGVMRSLHQVEVHLLRIDRNERRLQCDCAGLPRFTAELMSEAGFQRAVSRLSKQQRRKALAQSLEEGRDVATPFGALDFLTGYETKGWLVPQSKAFLDRILFETTTGPARLKAGFGSGWKLRHKTGTGRDVYGRSPARNDIGIAAHQDGRKIAIAVFLSGASGSDAERDAAIAQATKLIVDSL